MKKIKAHTLIELLVALMIGMIIISISASIVVKVNKNFNAANKLKAYLWIKNREKQFQIDQQVMEDTLRIGTILFFENCVESKHQNTLLYHVKAINLHHQFLCEKKSLIDQVENNKDQSEK